MEIEFVGRELTSSYRGDSAEFFLEIKKFYNNGWLAFDVHVMDKSAILV